MEEIEKQNNNHKSSIFSLFKKISKDESLAATKYVFRWNIKPDEVAKENAETKLQKAIKAHLAEGKKLYQTEGIIKK